MLSPSSASIAFATQFTQTIYVLIESTDSDGEPTTTQSTTIPVVSRSFNDPGVTISTSPGRVIISGLYRNILPISWSYIDLNNQHQTITTTPVAGTFKTIFRVSSPPRLSETCTYTIDGQTFTHTVSLPSYDPIANALKSLLATVA
jgi:hypothetical protein